MRAQSRVRQYRLPAAIRAQGAPAIRALVRAVKAVKGPRPLIRSYTQ